MQKRPNFCTRSILFCILSGEQLSQGFVHVHIISKKTEIGVGDRWWGISKDRMEITHCKTVLLIHKVFKIDPDPGLLFPGCPDAKKIIFFPQCFCLLLTVGIFASVFKDSKLLRRHNTIEIKVFLNCCVLMEGSGSDSGSAQIITNPELGNPITDPANQDLYPEHLYKSGNFQLI